MKRIITLIFIAFGLFANGQDLPILKSITHWTNAYSKSEQLIWQKTLELNSQINSGDTDYANLSKTDKKMIDSLEMGYGPMTEGVGCSWYCGGGPYKITASSYLNEQGKINYRPENIHDFDLFTAWVPNNENGTIGKKVNFHFKPFAPRVNEIFIWNGYLKNKDLWSANSRVAKFKLLINGKPTAILELENINNTQSFKINPVQSTDSIKDLILTLEIIEIYKGTKYPDVAISEINFNGLDVHCFSAGTKILMADGFEQNIESIKQGDLIASFDQTTDRLSKSKVTQLIQVRHTNLVSIKFDDREITVTDDHPFWTEKLTWSSINPEKSNNNYKQGTTVTLLSVGDKIFLPKENKFIEIKEIAIIEHEQMTYTIELIEHDNFIANGLMVKTEKVNLAN